MLICGRLAPAEGRLSLSPALEVDADFQSHALESLRRPKPSSGHHHRENHRRCHREASLESEGVLSSSVFVWRHIEAESYSSKRVI